MSRDFFRLLNLRWWRLFLDRLFDGGRRGGGWLYGLDEPRRRECRSSGLGGLRFLRIRCRLLGAGLGDWPFSEHVAAWERDAALAREALDELSRDDLFNRARRALQLDAVRAFQQRKYFLAARVEELRDLINTNGCQIFLLEFFFFCCRGLAARGREDPLRSLDADTLHFGQRVDAGERNLLGRIEPRRNQLLHQFVADAFNRK